MDNVSINSVSIIGYGRFGKLLASLLSPHYDIQIYDPNSALKTPEDAADIKTKRVTLEKALESQMIFIAVPIRQFESVIKAMSNKLKPGTTVIDVCSVKVHPVNLMKQHLSKEINIIATHPMFGPDSIMDKNNLKIMMHAVRDNNNIYRHWKQYFTQLNINIIEMTPDEHDQYAAESQGITHFIGRAFEEAKFHSTPIDTLGFKSLLTVAEQTRHDSWELFEDLQRFNPYTKAVTDRFIQSVLTINTLIYPRPKA